MTLHDLWQTVEQLRRTLAHEHRRAVARRKLCDSLHVRHGTPDLVLVSLANMYGTPEDKLLAQQL